MRPYVRTIERMSVKRGDGRLAGCGRLALSLWLLEVPCPKPVRVPLTPWAIEIWDCRYQHRLAVRP